MMNKQGHYIFYPLPGNGTCNKQPRSKLSRYAKRSITTASSNAWTFEQKTYAASCGEFNPKRLNQQHADQQV